MLPNGMPYKGKWADRRGRLSLQVLHSFQQNKQLVNLSTINSSTLPNHNFEL